MVPTIPLPRTCKDTDPPMVGLDIEAHGRAMHRALEDGHLDEFVHQPVSVRQTWGVGKVFLAQKCAEKYNLPQFGMMGPALYETLWRHGAYDAFAKAQLTEYSKSKYPSIVYIHDKSWDSHSGGFIHQTGGIAGNMALDFMAHPGTPVLAVQPGTISRTSGYDPSTGLHGSNRDVFGWSIYLKVFGGFYYITHFGRLAVSGGQKVEVGDIIGFVGDWPHDRGRSHSHAGFTSITRLSYMGIRQINKVAAAPRVAGRST